MGDDVTSTQHAIVGRDRPFEVDPARIDHFELGPGEPIDEHSLVHDPTWSLYALDPDRDRAMLVRLPPSVDLAAAPFAYVAQFEHAERAAVVPIERLIAMSADLPRPARLVHLFSTGRCGSTLASRIFAELDGIWSVSEPDAIAQLVTRRHEYGTPRMQEMLRAVSRWSYRPTAARPDETCVLKYRSEALFDVADYLIATPDSSAVFLYRDLPSWVDSTYRFAQRHDIDVSPGSGAAEAVWPIVSAAAPTGEVADICDVTDPATPIECVLASLWTMRVEAFEAARVAGLPLPAFSYAQLDDERERTVAALLHLLGHDSADNRRRAMIGYELDSQRGSAGARDVAARPLDDLQRARIAALTSDNDRVRAAVDFMDEVTRTS